MKKLNGKITKKSKGKITKRAKGKKIGTAVTGCNFTGVKYNEKAVETITAIALGLVENARSLGALAEVLKASNVTIETLLKVSS